MNPTTLRRCTARSSGPTRTTSSLRSCRRCSSGHAQSRPVQPLTSGVWQGTWADPGQRSTIAGIQLDNSDVISFHSYADPADFEGRIAELAPMQRPILCTEYLARTLGSSVEGILPVAARHGVGAFNWGLVAGKTQTYLPWDSWDHPDLAPPAEWFSDLLQLDGRPYLDSDVRTIRNVTPLLHAK